MPGALPRKLSRLHKPPGLSLEAWQRELRRQFGREQAFSLKNAGTEPVFSDFQVTNPQSRATYRVSIRGIGPGDNYCSCPDFATNTLGTCKHVEFVLGRLERRRGGRRAFLAGFEPGYSEIVLKYGARREVRFRPGTGCPPALRQLASRYFDSNQILRPEAYLTVESFLSKAATFDHDLARPDGVGLAPARGRRARPAAAAEPAVAAAADPWSGPLQTGLGLLEQLAVASRSPDQARGQGLRFVVRDPETGRDYLRGPMPGPDVLDRALNAIGSLIDRLKR